MAAALPAAEQQDQTGQAGLRVHVDARQVDRLHLLAAAASDFSAAKPTLGDLGYTRKELNFPRCLASCCGRPRTKDRSSSLRPHPLVGWPRVVVMHLPLLDGRLLDAQGSAVDAA
jgi:hypothetical protein